MKWFIRENERWAVQFKIHRVEADWLEKGRQKDYWTRAMIARTTRELIWMNTLDLQIWFMLFFFFFSVLVFAMLDCNFQGFGSLPVGLHQHNRDKWLPALGVSSLILTSVYCFMLSENVSVDLNIVNHKHHRGNLFMRRTMWPHDKIKIIINNFIYYNK